VLFPSESITGAKLKAHGGQSGDNGSDFYLVLLSQSIPDSFNVYMNGWNRKDTASPSGVGIHHPEGDVKKISTYLLPLVSTNYMGGPVISHWQVIWAQTANGHGVTEGGSPGSPIFDNNGMIVGTLTGGFSNCDSASLNSADYYGKFSYSWKSNGSDSASRLDYWLDPGNTGVYYLQGSPLAIENPAVSNLLTLYPNPFTDRLEISPADSQVPLELSVYDLAGSLCFRKNFLRGTPSPITLNLSGLSPGVYILKATSEHGTTSRKIIKQ
jgi:hypothetical protein